MGTVVRMVASPPTHIHGQGGLLKAILHLREGALCTGHRPPLGPVISYLRQVGGSGEQDTTSEAWLGQQRGRGQWGRAGFGGPL